MCGIAGFVYKDGRNAEPAKLKAMTNALSHRGPDAEGQLCAGHIALGHRRLSIIDLSEAGSQPMKSLDGRFVITFNGEIYNYLELRAELIQCGAAFATGTDTEVIIEAYRAWGADCLNQFNGMWAFVIYDTEKNELFLARDRFAVKPLYTLDRDDLFMFASEPRAILAAEPAENMPDLVSIYRLLTKRAPEDIDAHSWYQNIKIFPPASYGLYALETHALTVSRYWKPDIAAFHEKRVAGKEPVRALKALFEDAVRLRLRADVEVGVCLSGGLDSSAVVGCCKKKFGKRMKTFSSRYADKSCDERAFIDCVNRFTQSDAHPIFPDEKYESFIVSFEKLISNHGGPPGDVSLYSQFRVFKEVGKHVKVVLDGQGADELFGGYASFLNPYLRRLAMGGKRYRAVRAAYALLKESDRLDAASLSCEIGVRLFGLERFKKLAVKTPDWSSERADVKRDNPMVAKAFAEKVSDAPIRTVDCDTADDISAMCINQTLITMIPHLCHNEDANSMDSSVEVRMPFLDYRLVEFALALGSDYKLRGIWQKWIIRKALKRYLPLTVRRRRDKMAYPAPFFIWLRESEEREGFRELIFAYAKRGFTPPETVRAYYDAHMSGRANMQQELFRFITLELWLRTCDFTTLEEAAAN